MTWTSARALRIGSGIGSQAISSLMGLIVSLAVARSASPSAFGAFALALSGYYLALGASRALTSEPFIVRFSGSAAEAFEYQAGRAAGLTVTVGLGAAGVCEMGALLCGEPMRQTLAALGLVIPILLLQDFLRFAAFSQNRGSVALVSDALWALGVGITMATAEIRNVQSAGLLLLAWGVPALGGALLSMYRLRVTPHPSAARSWLRTQRDLAPRYLAEFAAFTGSSQLAFYLVGVIGGLAAAASIRGAEVLMGPLIVLYMGIGLVAVPEAVTIRHRSTRQLMHFSLLLSGLLTVAALVWEAGILLLPASVGHLLLGDTWDLAAPIAPITALYMAGMGAISGAFVGLRALAAARRSLRVQLTLSPITISAAGIGAYLDGAHGAAVALASTTWVFGVTLWWLSYRSELHTTTHVADDKLGHGDVTVITNAEN